jgi:hypothetical protein
MVVCGGNEMVTIDAAAVARITGVPIGTLNVWIQRGLVPGISVGTKGLAREFDLDTVLHIAVTVALVQLGYGAPFASMAAAESRNGFERTGAKLIIGPPRRNVYGRGVTPTIDCYIPDEKGRPRTDLNAFLGSFSEGRPEAFTVVELDRLAARVRQAFQPRDLAERARRQRQSVRKSKGSE